MIRFHSMLAAGALALCLTAIAGAAGVHVQDGGHFFSAIAVEKAEAELARLEAERGKKVFVETFDAAPPEVASRLQNDSDANARAAAFEAFGRGQAIKRGVDTYIVVNRTPSHLRVITDAVAGRAGLNDAARDAIAAAMVAKFKAKDYDAGLLDAVGTIEKSFAGGLPMATSARPSAAAGTAAPRSTPSPSAAPADARPAGNGWGLPGWLPLIIIAVVIFIIFRAIRGAMALGRQNQFPPSAGGPAGYGQPGYGQPGYGQPGGGGGGFGRGLLGGLLGGAAGGYFANRAFGQGNDRRSDADANSGAFGGNDAPADAGFGSSGGDFGSTDSSGGDFGGGDAGGGDGGGSSGGDF